MKLSKKEIQVLALMREGAELSRHYQYSKFITSIAPWLVLGSIQIKLSLPMVDKMIEKSVIRQSDRKSLNPHLREVFYELTDLGKTIDI